MRARSTDEKYSGDRNTDWGEEERGRDNGRGGGR